MFKSPEYIDLERFSIPQNYIFKGDKMWESVFKVT